ncbi:MAG: hypothetical protein Q9218_005193 [Villophora microphyllina]
MVRESTDMAESTQEASSRLQDSLRLSMKSENNLREMLMAARFAINFLGQLRLLAFSDDALKISLGKPEKGFDYLKSSYPQELLECLKNLDLAERRLRPLMENLQSGMSRCAKKANNIQMEFEILVAITDELNVAMGHQMSESDKRKADTDYRRAEINDRIQQDLRASLKLEYERFDRDAAEASTRFYKTAKGNEWKALGFKTVSDAEAGVAGLISGAVGIVKEVPKLATQVVNAAGALGGAATRFMSMGSLAVPSPGQSEDAFGSSSQQQGPNRPSRAGPTEAPESRVDPALISINRMESSINQIYEIVHQDLLPIILEDGQNQELLQCSEQLKAHKEELGDYRSQYVVKAKAMLDQGIRTADEILTSDQLAGSVRDSNDVRWQMKVQVWRREMRTAHSSAIYMKAVARTQAGQGFGDALLDIPV